MSRPRQHQKNQYGSFTESGFFPNTIKDLHLLSFQLHILKESDFCLSSSSATVPLTGIPDLCVNPASATCWFCDLGQVISSP